MVEVFAMEFRL